MIKILLITLTNIVGVLSTTSWCNDSQHKCRMGCSSPQCSSSEWLLEMACASIIVSLYPQCSCLLGYRNGARSDSNLCMGPSKVKTLLSSSL